MIRKLLHNLRASIWLYILTLCNIVYAIDTKDVNWLLWVAVGLSLLSLVINIITAVKENRNG